MKSNDTKEMDETTTTTTTKTTCWGTWEELLLACAVNRHGSKSWESVAMEIQNRTSSPQLLTPDNCRTKYYQLQRRFVANDELEAEEEEKIIPVLLDELRKLRVQELKSEVQRNDASIMSLQLKVKRLTEDRERSLRENKELTSDLKEREEEEGRGGEPEKLNVDRVSGEDSVRENQSFKESNSTDPEGENDQEIAKVEKTEEESEPEPEPEPVQTSSGKPGPVRVEEVVVPGDKPAGEGSYNASSGTVVKELAVLIAIEKEKAEEGGRSREDGDSTEGGLWESKEAREEEERNKENSDVQSSVSLSSTRRRVKAVSMSSSRGGDEREREEVSPAKNRISDESEPLLHYFKIVKSNKYGSVFDRRLQSQKSDKYKSLIRLHIDLEIIKTRIDEGHYSECNRKFLRDLLLLVNNALTFFPKNSDENNAALELRMLVTKSISPRILKPTAPPEPPVVAKPSKSVKPEPAVPSRKRSATERKAAVAVVVEAEAEPVRDCSDGKKNTRERKRERERERLASGTRSSRTNGSALKGTATRNLSRDRNPASDSKGAGAIIDGSEVKKEKYSKEATADAKKRGAAELLDRIKRNSSNGGPLLEKLKNSSKGGGSDGGGTDAQQRNVASAYSSEGVDTKRKGASGHSEVVDVKRKGGASGHSEGVDTKQKGGGGLGEGTKTAKRNVGKGGETEHNKQKAGGGSSGARERRRRDHGTRSEKRLQQEEKSPPKRNVGRPPKRSAVAAAATTPPIKRKRNGDTEDVRGSSGSRPSRKRTRR